MSNTRFEARGDPFGWTAGDWLKMPMLGPARESLQKTLEAIQAQTRFTEVAVDFGQRFSLPLADCLGAFAQMTGDRAAGIDSTQALYDRFLAELDDRYQSYLQSSEGVRAVGELVDAFLDCRERWKIALEPMAAFFNLPGPREMQDVYRGLHALKKTTRLQRDALQRQTEIIERLEARVRELESTAPKAQRRRAATKQG